MLPAETRSAFAALWNLDVALADVVATTSDPRLGAIRLAWWRDRLAALDTDKAPRGEPRLEAVDQFLMQLTNGSTLSMIANAWMALLEPFPWGEEAANGLRSRGELLFAIGAQIIGCDRIEAEPAGALWSLADGAFHCSDPRSREFLRGEALAALARVPQKMARRIRPLTMLSALAAHDILDRRPATRGFAALGHRLRGTIPR